LSILGIRMDRIPPEISYPESYGLRCLEVSLPHPPTNNWWETGYNIPVVSVCLDFLMQQRPLGSLLDMKSMDLLHEGIDWLDCKVVIPCFEEMEMPLWEEKRTRMHHILKNVFPKQAAEGKLCMEVYHPLTYVRFSPHFPICLDLGNACTDGSCVYLDDMLEVETLLLVRNTELVHLKFRHSYSFVTEPFHVQSYISPFYGNCLGSLKKWGYDGSVILEIPLLPVEDFEREIDYVKLMLQG